VSTNNCGFGTCVGIDPWRTKSASALPWFPRTRGDRPRQGRHQMSTQQVPPHARG